MKNILKHFIIYLVVFSIAIFLVGVFETTRNEFLFNLVEENLLNAENTPTIILNKYFDFRNSFIFTNTIFTNIINFFSMLGLFYLFVLAWREGRNSRPYTLVEIYSSYSMILILLLYLGFIIFNYITNIFLNQLIILLFEEIYNALFIYKLFIEYFIPLILIAYFVSFLGNMTKYYDVFN